MGAIETPRPKTNSAGGGMRWVEDEEQKQIKRRDVRTLAIWSFRLAGLRPLPSLYPRVSDSPAAIPPRWVVPTRDASP